MLDTTGVTAALWCPTDGYLQPNSLVMAYAHAARDRGVTFATHTTVTGLRITGDAVDGIVAGDRCVATDMVINAAGPWAGALPSLPGLHLPTAPVRPENCATQAVSGWHAGNQLGPPTSSPSAPGGTTPAAGTGTPPGLKPSGSTRTTTAWPRSSHGDPRRQSFASRSPSVTEPSDALHAPWPQWRTVDDRYPPNERLAGYCRWAAGQLGSWAAGRWAARERVTCA